MPEDATIPPAAAGDLGDAAPRLTDLHMTERALRQGWPISDEKRREITEQMTKLASAPETRPRTRAMAVRVLAQLDSLNLRDQHHVERLEAERGIVHLRMQRAEEGKPNDCVAVQVTPVRELPLPDAMRSMRKRLLEPTEN